MFKDSSSSKTPELACERPTSPSPDLTGSPDTFRNLLADDRLVGRVARTINPKTNLGAPYAGFACGDFDFAVFLFLLCVPEPFTPPSCPGLATPSLLTSNL
jgi:hypothetical protein